MSEQTYDGYGHTQRLNANTTEDELIELYSAWSKTYDKDVHNLDYTGPAVAAEQLTGKLAEFGFKKDISVLDLGCGSGLVGEQLHKRGYQNIDGLDISEEFLEEARKKGVYRSLNQGHMSSDQCKNLGVSANLYDAAICVGVFTLGHVKAKGLDDVVHVIKPGGLACFGVNGSIADNAEYGFREKMDQLSKEKKWKMISKHYEPNYFKGGWAWFYVYQIL